MSRWSAGWVLMIASPFVMAAVIVSLGMLEDRGLIAFDTKYGYLILRGNAALAVLGTVAGAAILPAAPIHRFCLALGLGFLSFVAYFATFFAGAFMFLRLDI